MVKPHLKKFDDTSKPMMFIGYEPDAKAYCAYDLVGKRVHVTHDVILDEEAKWDWTAHGDIGTQTAPGEMFFVEYTSCLVAGGERVDTPRLVTSEPATPCHVPRTGPQTTVLSPSPTSPAASPTTTAPVAMVPIGAEFVSLPSSDTPSSNDAPRQYRTLKNLYDTSSAVELNDDMLYLMGAEEPENFVEAERHRSWRQAMLNEMQSIKENSTWELVDPSAGHRPIALKWVFKVKDSKGVVVKHKARLVARGFVQQ